VNTIKEFDKRTASAVETYLMGKGYYIARVKVLAINEDTLVLMQK
jgi:hypothetical protein